MLPELNLDNAIEASVAESSKINQGKTFLYDFDKGDFVLRDGKLVGIEGVEGVKVWINKVLRTEKFKFKIYETEEDQDEYGVTIKKLVSGRKFPVFFLESELEREITESLMKNVEINNIKDFKIEQQLTTLTIYFTVVLKNEESFAQEVNF